MKAKIKGLPTHGYHSYKPDGAGMLIKLLSIFPVVEIQGEEMFPTETVTFFNDLCLFAPARLIDERISWESIDDFSAKATFTTGGAPISAVLSFNEKGQLINFISNDRFSVSEMKSYPFRRLQKTMRSLTVTTSRPTGRPYGTTRMGNLFMENLN